MIRRPAGLIAALLCVAALTASCTPAAAPGPEPSVTTRAPGTTTTAAPGATPPASTTTGPAATTSTPPAAPTTATTAATSSPTTEPVVGEAEARRLAATVLAAGLRLPYLDADTAAHLAAGGRAVILSGDAVTAGGPQLRALTSEAACAAGVPVVAALEQDLGREIDGVPTVPPTFEEAGAMAPAEVTAAARRLGEDLVGLGINLNLAPAVDLAPGADPDTVAAVGAAFAAGLAEAGVGAAPGHFPGIGRAAGGTTEIGAGELASRDLVPFEALVATGVPVVVVADAVFTSIDPGTAASRSPAVLALLRDSLGFTGVALAGPGPDDGGDAVTALAAGIDLLVVGDPAALEPAVREIAAAVAAGRLPAGRLAEAAERVEALAALLARVPCVGDG